jgi:hypothetical protein
MALHTGEVLLKNNQSTYADLLTFNTLTFKGADISYTVIRGDLVEQGEIHLSFNRFANEAQFTSIANFDDAGVRFCAMVDKSYFRLRYTSSNTGIKPIFKHNIIYYPL